MDKEQLQQRLAKLKNDLEKKKKKLQKCERLAQAREHVKKKIQEQTELMLQGEKIHVVSSHVHTKVSFEEELHSNIPSTTAQYKPSSVTFQSTPTLDEDFRQGCEYYSPKQPAIPRHITETPSGGQDSSYSLAPAAVDSCNSNAQVLVVPESESPSYVGSTDCRTHDKIKDDLQKFDISSDISSKHNLNPNGDTTCEEGIKNLDITYVVEDEQQQNFEHDSRESFRKSSQIIMSQDSVDTMDSDVGSSLGRRVRQISRKNQHIRHSGEPLRTISRLQSQDLVEGVVTHTQIDNQYDPSVCNQYNMDLVNKGNLTTDVLGCDNDIDLNSDVDGRYVPVGIEFGCLSQSESQMPDDEGNIAFINDGDLDSQDTFDQSLGTQQITRCETFQRMQFQIEKEFLPVISYITPDKIDDIPMEESEVIAVTHQNHHHHHVGDRITNVINEPYDSNLEPRSSELESISLDISSQEDLFIGNVPRKMRRHSEAAMMDFSFLEEETGDMYSQIKSRKNRRDRGLSLDCGDLYPFPDETPLKWLQEQNTPDALSSERVTDKESESSTKNTARANSPRTVLHDHDYVTENALNEEESSSQSLIRSSRRSEGKRTTTDNHGNLLTIFPSVPYGHAQGKSQVSEFSLPLNDYGDLMVDKVDSPQHLSDDLVESAKMIKIISTIKPHEDDKTDLTQDLGDVIGDQSTPGCPLVITEDRDQQLMNIRSDTLPSNDACEQEMQSDTIPTSCSQTLKLNVPSPETTDRIELNTEQHTPEMYSESSEWSHSINSNSLLDNINSKSGPLLSYHSSVKFECEEPLLSVRSGCRDTGQTHEMVIGCTSLRVLVWTPKGRGWRLVREWSLEQLQAECIVSCELLTGSTQVYILTTTHGSTQLTAGCTVQGNQTLQLKWTTSELCTLHCEKHYSVIVSELEMVVGGVMPTGETKLMKITMPPSHGSQNNEQMADSIMLDCVEECLVSVVSVDCLRDALLGASESTLYIWNLITGRMIHTVILALEILSCPAVYHQQGILFMVVINATNKAGEVMAVNPVTGGSCLLHELQTNNPDNYLSMKHLQCSGQYVCGQDGRGSTNIWRVDTGQLVASTNTVSTQTAVHLHSNRLLVTSNTGVHVYKLSH